MTEVRFEENDVSTRDPDRAAAIERAIRQGLLENEQAGEVRCSVYVVGWEPKLLRVEFHREGWYHNLPLMPLDVTLSALSQLSRSVVVGGRA
jgi:hypothetical protein